MSSVTYVSLDINTVCLTLDCRDATETEASNSTEVTGGRVASVSAVCLSKESSTTPRNETYGHE